MWRFVIRSSHSLIQEVFQQPVSMFGQNGFGMKLQTLYRQSLVAHPHDFSIFCPCGNFEAIGKGFTLDGERMVANRREWVGQSFEQSGVIVVNRRCLAVHQLLRMNNFSAKSLSDALMAKAYP